MALEAAQTYLQGLEARLRADGCATRWDRVGSLPVLVARRSDFRFRWMATRLHLFTVAAAVPDVDLPSLRLFEEDAAQYAKSAKGGLPVGLQTGIAVFCIMVGDRVDPAAQMWASGPERKRFALLSRPVVVDAGSGSVSTFRRKRFWGWVYAGYLNKKVATYFPQPTELLAAQR